jgi:diguanylate cyclase (GGDEF)-like protein/PAS domain S-box-containing protein
LNVVEIEMIATNPKIDDFSDICLQAIDGSGVGVWDRNLGNGQIRYSRSWFAILGYDDGPSHNHIEESYKRIHPDDLAYVQGQIQEYCEGKTSVYAVEHRLRCKNGNYKWVISRGKIIEHDGDRPLRMVGTTTDITDIREITEDLRIQNIRTEEDARRLSLLMDELTRKSDELAAAHRLARVGAWRWDLLKGCLWFSAEVWWMMGLKPMDDAVSYERMRQIFHPDDYQGAMDCFYDAVKTKAAITKEYRIVYPDGSVRNILSYAEPVTGPDGQISGLRGTSQDVTEHRRIETALRESEDHYRHMVELHPQIPWLAGPDGRILEVGPQWYTITGIPRGQALPSGWLEAVFDEDRAAIAAAWKKCRNSGERLDIEYRLRLVDGSYGWFRARASARFDVRGQIVRWDGTLEDVTDRHLAEAARREAEAAAFRVLEATSDAVVICDGDQRIIFANAKFGIKLGLQGDIKGRTIGEIFGEAHARKIRRAVYNVLNNETNHFMEFFWPPTDIWMEVSIVNNEKTISLFMRDITEKRATQKELQYLASHDVMTGAVTRETQFKQLVLNISRQSQEESVALLFIDIDFFKEVNDNYGHPTGDGILVELAFRLQSCLRGTDMLARTGGDEFVIMLTGVRSLRGVTAFAERISAAMHPPVAVDGHMLSCSISIGIAVSTPDSTAKDLYRQADLALYEVKKSNRGSYQFFRPEMQHAFELRGSIRTDLKVALGRNEFELMFQPIVQVSDRQIKGVEALLRWHHPSRGLVSPAQFIPIAEESGFIRELGAWVLHQACMAALEWPDSVMISVNVSPRQLEPGDFLTVVQEALRASGLPARRLKLEVTESVLVANHEANIRVLQNLRSLGVSLALDDFGVGYSSLSYLNTFRFDFLKIDKQFISEVRDREDRQPVFEAIMGMAAALNLPVTAEGVETDIQLDYVISQGCSFVQGYIFDPPLQADVLYDRLLRQDLSTNAHNTYV